MFLARNVKEIIFSILFVLLFLSNSAFAEPFDTDHGLSVLLETPLSPAFAFISDLLGFQSLGPDPMSVVSGLLLTLMGFYLLYRYSKNRKIEDVINPYATSEAFYEIEQESRPNTLKRIIAKWNKNRIDFGIGFVEAFVDLIRFLFIGLPSLLVAGVIFYIKISDEDYRREVLAYFEAAGISGVVSDFISSLMSYYAHDADRHPFRCEGRMMFDIITFVAPSSVGLAGKLSKTGRMTKVASEASKVVETGNEITKVASEASKIKIFISLIKDLPAKITETGKKISISKILGTIEEHLSRGLNRVVTILKDNRWSIDGGDEHFPFPHVHIPLVDAAWKPIGNFVQEIGKHLKNWGAQAMKRGESLINSAETAKQYGRENAGIAKKLEEGLKARMAGGIADKLGSVVKIFGNVIAHPLNSIFSLLIFSGGLKKVVENRMNTYSENSISYSYMPRIGEGIGGSSITSSVNPNSIDEIAKRYLGEDNGSEKAADTEESRSVFAERDSFTKALERERSLEEQMKEIRERFPETFGQANSAAGASDNASKAGEVVIRSQRMTKANYKTANSAPKAVVIVREKNHRISIPTRNKVAGINVSGGSKSRNSAIRAFRNRKNSKKYGTPLLVAHKATAKSIKGTSKGSSRIKMFLREW